MDWWAGGADDMAGSRKVEENAFGLVARGRERTKSAGFFLGLGGCAKLWEDGRFLEIIRSIYFIELKRFRANFNRLKDKDSNFVQYFSGIKGAV